MPDDKLTMETVTLSTTTTVQPESLGADLQSAIQKQINAKYMNKCTEKEGIIIRVYEPVKVISNVVLRDNISIKFYVQVTLDRILPAVGMVFHAQAVTIVSDGLFLNYHGLCVLVPRSTFGGEFQASPNAHFRVKNRTISQGDVLLVRIIKCQWSPPIIPANALAQKAAAAPQGKFKVIGELVI